jgi:hypothetical protein
VRARLAILGTLALACSSGEIAYAPDTDARFADAVLGTYTSTASGLVLTVCEDTDAGALACQDLGQSDCGGSCHVIRGGGRGASESIAAQGRGCDCATPNAELSVRAALALAGGSRLDLRGTIAVAPSEGDPYGAPLALRVTASGDHLAPSLRGEIRDGTMRLRLSSPPDDAGPGAWPADPTSAVAFTRSGPCP